MKKLSPARRKKISARATDRLIFYLSATQWKLFNDALNTPPRPNPRLRRLLNSTPPWTPRMSGGLVKERESIIATLEILADRELADRLLRLSKPIDEDVAAGRLLTTADVFSE